MPSSSLRRQPERPRLPGTTLRSERRWTLSYERSTDRVRAPATVGLSPGTATFPTIDDIITLEVVYRMPPTSLLALAKVSHTTPIYTSVATPAASPAPRSGLPHPSRPGRSGPLPLPLLPGRLSRPRSPRRRPSEVTDGVVHIRPLPGSVASHRGLLTSDA
jgi:hypothetical protein